MAVTANPQQVAQRWSQGMAGSTDKMKQGIDAVTEAPTAKAAASVNRYLAGVQEAAASGKWQRGLERVTLDQWKTAMKDKGLLRIAGGAAAAQTKFAQFMSEFLPWLSQGVQSLPARGSFEENVARATAMMRHNHQFRRNR